MGLTEQAEHDRPTEDLWQRMVTVAEKALPNGAPDRLTTLRVPRERRRHARTSPPDVSNGMAYTLRAIAIAVPLVLSDLASLLMSILLASVAVGLLLPFDPSMVVRLGLALSAGLVVTKGAMGLYPAIGVPPLAELRKSGLATLLWFGAFLLAGLVWEAEASAHWVLLIGGLASLWITPVLRGLTRKTLSRFRWWSQPLLIFGDGSASRRLAEYYRRHPELGLIPISVPDGVRGNGADIEPTVRTLASRHRAACAAIPWDAASGDQPAGLFRESFNTFPHVLIVPDTSRALGAWKEVTDFGGVAGVRGGKGLLFPMQRSMKRVVDSTFALFLCLITLPLFVVVALAIKATSSGPVFFGHRRIGRDRKPFRAWKFRSMHVNADELLKEHLANDPEAREEWVREQKLKNDPRLTPVGRFLRRTSLDELPQLWNVVRGEMSLVGPRPIVEDEVAKYGSEFERYMTVPPGITGLWQVSGRNNTTYEERVELDAVYVENWSLTLDAYILGKTVEAVLTGEGAY